MLPFLKQRKIASVIMAKRKPDGAIEPISEEGEETPELMSAAEDLIRALHSKDAGAVAAALKAAFQMMDSAEEEPMEMPE